MGGVSSAPSWDLRQCQAAVLARRERRTLIVSLEAILLAPFVMIGQNWKAWRVVAVFVGSLSSLSGEDTRESDGPCRYSAVLLTNVGLAVNGRDRAAPGNIAHTRGCL